MANPLTRQDLMAITDGAKNTIMQRLITRNDVQGATDNARDRILNTINAYHVETQTLIRQANSQNDQMWRRIATVESQVMSLRQELRTLTQSINRLYEAQAQQMQQTQQMRQAVADFGESQI